jgi:SAF domain-containing protein
MSEVSLRLRVAADHLDPPSDAVDAPASPPAARRRRTRWQDPRLWLGIVLVLASIVLGARVLAAADDTVAVWQLARDVPAGTALSAADLRLTRVHFDDPAVAGQYISADHSLDPGARATRDLMAGEMLASSALTSAAAPATRQLPLGVDAVHAPADLRVGDHVQVWAVPSSGPGPGTHPAAPSLVLSDVTVLSAGGSVVGVSAERQVLVGLTPRTDVGAVLQRITGSAVVLIRLAG